MNDDTSKIGFARRVFFNKISLENGTAIKLEA